MEEQITGKYPIVWNNYWISNRCLKADNINSIEYTMILGCTLCSIRILNNKVTEMYFYDRTQTNQILSITEHSYNKYTQVDGIITRDDGAVYEYTETGLVRLGDQRTYTTVYCNPKELNDIVYTAYYFLYNSKCLEEYKKQLMYNIDLLNIQSLQALISEINNYTDSDKADFVKSKQIIKEYS